MNVMAAAILLLLVGVQCEVYRENKYHPTPTLFEHLLRRHGSIMKAPAKDVMRGNNRRGIEEDSVKEMVYNGDFEQPQISAQWETVQALPGGNGFWSSYPPANGFVLWKQGAMGSPTVDSLGNPTGQTLEINGNVPTAWIGYRFQVPQMQGAANTTLSFQYWFTPANHVYYFGVSVKQDEEQVLYQSLPSVGNWTEASFDFQLQPSSPAQVYFSVDAGSIGGVYIDFVSVTIAEDPKPDDLKTKTTNLVQNELA